MPIVDTLPTEHPSVRGLTLRGPIEPRPTRSYGDHYTASCSPAGDGVCDGYDPDGTFCSCPCHDTPELPQTVEGVRDWHDEYHDVVRHATGAYVWMSL